MIDLELVDRLFEIGHQHGELIAFINFAKRALLPLEQVTADISSATGKGITREDLTRMGDLGWIPLLSVPHDPEGGIGIPLYAPTRIELLLELEREGYSATELRAIAECEEVTIDYILTTEELTYTENELALVVQHMRDMLLHAEQHESDEVTVGLSGAPISCDQFQRKLISCEMAASPPKLTLSAFRGCLSITVDT